MAIEYAFLVGSFALTAVWAALYWARQELRESLLIGSALALPLSFLEPWFLKDYWAPPSLFGWSEHHGLSVESFVFSFALGGLACLGGVIWTLRTSGPLTLTHRAHIVSFYCLFILSIWLLDLLFTLRSIDTVCAAQTLTAVFVCLFRPELCKAVMAGGTLLCTLYFAGFVAFDACFPHFIGLSYFRENLWGIEALGIPVEELAFAFSAGACWSGLVINGQAQFQEEPGQLLPSSVESVRD